MACFDLYVLLLTSAHGRTVEKPGGNGELRSDREMKLTHELSGDVESRLRLLRVLE